MLPQLNASYNSRRGSAGSPAWGSLVLYTGASLSLLILLLAYTFTPYSRNQPQDWVDEAHIHASSQLADEVESNGDDWSIAALADGRSRDGDNADRTSTGSTARDGPVSDGQVERGDGERGGGGGGGQREESETERGGGKGEEGEGGKGSELEGRDGKEASEALPRPPRPGTLQLVKVIQAAVDGAVCLDGSPPSYYFRRGYGRGATNWVIHFQGGAWCSNPNDCFSRSKSDYGSSSQLPPTKMMEGVFSGKREVNPDMHNWNVVHLNYCDGGSFAGHREEALRVQGESIYVRGRLVRDALFNHLLAEQGMKDATKVVITGCSAGGLASLLHCDHIKQSFLPSLPHDNYACMPDAGVFLDIANTAGERTARTIFEDAFTFQQAQDGVDQDCRQSKPQDQQYECFFAQYSIPFTSSRLFIVNSNYDTWSLLELLAPMHTDKEETHTRKCLMKGFAQCEEKDFEPIKEFREQMVATWHQLPGSSNGAFLFSCLAHCSTYHDWLWTNLTVRGQPMWQVFGRWFRGESSEDGSRVVDCAYPCNNCDVGYQEMTEFRMFF